MKTNSFEQSLNRAGRALYGSRRHRTAFFKGLTALLAVQMAFLGMAPAAMASVLGDLKNTPANVNDDGTLKPGNYLGLPGGVTFMDGNDNVTIASGGATVFSTSGHWDITGGSLTCPAWVYLLAKQGITFGGGSINAAGLVAAAMNSFHFANTYNINDVGGDITFSGTSINAPSGQFYIGQNVSGAPSGATILETAGITAKDSGNAVTFSVDGGGSITFVNAKVGSGNVQAAGGIDFGTGGGTVAGGTVAASDAVAGNVEQTGGTIAAKTISGAITQTGGTIDAGTAGLTLGSGSSIGGTVVASSVTVGNNGSGTLTLTANSLQGTTLNAGTVNLSGAGTAFTLDKANINTLQSGTSGGNPVVAGAVTVNNAGALALGTLSAASLDATAGGAITQTGAANINGTATVTAQKTVSGNTTKYDVTLGNANNKFGSIGATGANITIAESDATALNAVSANSLQVTANGAITQNGATTITAADGTTTLDAGANKITLSQGVAGASGVDAGKLTLKSDTDVASAVAVSEIDATGKAFTQTGAGTITVSGNNGIKASAITQDASAGTIKAQKLDVGTAGTVTQNGGTINGTSENGNLTITGALDQNAGMVNVGTGTLTLGANSTLSSTVNAGKVNAAGQTLTQTAGTFTVTGTDGIVAEKVSQTGNGIIQTDKITGAVEQTGAAKLQANGSTLVLDGNVVQNNADATIGTTSTGVTVNQDFTQTAGKIEAATLTLGNGNKTYNLSSEKNNVKKLVGNAKSATINNGNYDLSIGKTETMVVAGQEVENRYGIYTTDGLTITKAGAVTDDGTGIVNGTVKIEESNGVTLDNSENLSVAGAKSSGDINLQTTGKLTLSGAVDTTTTGGNITLTAMNKTDGLGNVITAGAIDATAAAATITAADGKAVTATADATATFGAAVQGGSVDLTAKGGNLTTAVVESKAGKVSLKAGTASTNPSEVKAGQVIANDTVTATGGDIEATAQGDIVLSKALDASNAGAVTLTAANGGAIDATAAAATITAADGKAVTATADATATFGAAVQGGSVDLTAKGGNLTTAVVESKAGKVSLKAGTASTNPSEVKAGQVIANDTVTATGGDIEATAQGDIVLSKALDASNAGAVTLTAANGGAIDATAAAATITAADGKAVTATADATATFGAAVQGGSVDLTAKGGNLTTAAIVSTSDDVKLAAGTAAVAATETEPAVPAVAGAIQANGAISAKGNVLASALGAATFEEAVGAVDGNVRLETVAPDDATAATLTTKKAVTGQSVSLIAADKITASAEVKATAGDIVLDASKNGVEAAALTAVGNNVVVKAGNATDQEGNVVTPGQATLSGTISAQNVGVEAGTLATLADSQLSGVKTLALKATAGDVTLNGVPASVDTLAVAASGNLTLTADRDVTLNGGAVSAKTVAADGTLPAQGDATVNVDGLEAGEKLKVDVGNNTLTANAATGADIDIDAGTVDVTTITQTATQTNPDGKVDIDAGTATISTVNADGDVQLTASGNSASVNTIAAGGAVDVDVANGTATLTTVNAGGAVDVDAETADVAAVNAAGAVHVEATTGDATVGTVQGTTVEVVADNANAVVQDSVSATAGNASVTAANGAVNGGNVSASGGDATVSGRSVTVGDVVATAANDVGGNAAVTATDGNIVANDVTATGTADVTASGSVTARDIDAGGQATVAGTSVTARNIRGNGTSVTARTGNVDVSGQIGRSGVTEISADNGVITAGTIVSGDDLNLDANGIDAGIDAGGDANLTVRNGGDLTLDGLAAGGDVTLDIAGDADVGNLGVGGDLNGTVGGAFSTDGGTTGSIGQDGGLAVGSAAINGNLASGPVTMTAPGGFQLNGDLNAGTVNIAAGGFTGNGLLTSGNLTLVGGNIGSSAAAPLRLQTAGGATINLNGGSIYMEEVGSGRWIQIGDINASGVLSISAPSIGGSDGMQGGFINGSIHSGGDMTLNIGGQFGAQGYTLHPVSASIGNGGHLIINYGNLNPAALDPSYIHVALNVPGGTLVTPDEGDRAGFILYQYNGGGFQVIGASAEQTRLINRALEFTLNTPELKSKQGIFGDPAFVHTKMNVSEARSMGNMDMLELNDVDYSRTWRELDRPASARVIEAWSPAVDMSEDGPVNRKMGAVKSEAEQQPEVRAFERVAAPTGD